MNRPSAILVAMLAAAGCGDGKGGQSDALDEGDVAEDTAQDITAESDAITDTLPDTTADTAEDDTEQQDVLSFCGNLSIDPGEDCDPPGSMTYCTTACATSGTGYCRDGCLQALPEDCSLPPELCNLRDEDCDGLVDEGTIVPWDRQIVLAAGAGPSAPTLDVASTPYGFVVVWVVDGSTEPDEIHAANIDQLGRPIDPDTFLALSVDEVLGRPAVVWTGSSSLLSWISPTTGRNAAVIAPDLTVGAQNATAALSPGASPDLVWSGFDASLVWVEAVASDPEVFMVFVGADGVDQSAPLRVSNAVGLAAQPHVDANGSDVVVTWIDSRTGAEEVHLAAFDHSGAETVSDQAMTTTGGACCPSASADHRLVTFVDDRDATHKAWSLALDASFEPMGTESELSESTSALLSADAARILLATQRDLSMLESDGTAAGSAVALALGSIDGLQQALVASLAAGTDGTTGADLLATVFGCGQLETCSSWTDVPVILETRTGGDAVDGYVGHDAVLAGGFDARPVTYISIQIFASSPFDGPTAPSGHLLTGTPYDQCGVCVLLYESCGSTSCEHVYLARGGKLIIDEIGYEGDTFAGRLLDAQLAEVDINPADRTSTWVDGGSEICIGSYSFDEPISGI